MQIEIITYRVASGNPKPGFEWTAYVVLPNGEYWGVRFNGSTEELARSKAIALWTKERERFKKSVEIKPEEESDLAVEPNPMKPKPGMPGYFANVLATAKLDDPWKAPSDGRGKHFAGKVWMRHPDQGLKRLALTEIALYEKNGFVRSGPRAGK